MKTDIPGFASVEAPSLSCEAPGAWRLEASRAVAPDGAEILRVRLAADAPAPPPRFDVSFVAPQPGVRWIWTSQSDVPVLPPEWGGKMRSHIASQSPLLVLGGCDGLSRLSVACSEATRLVDWRYGLYEEDGLVHVRLGFFHEPEAPLASYEAEIRLDAAARDWADAARAASDWVCARPGYAPMPVPDAAFDPLYSTWYGYHQDVHDKDLEREFAEAAALGMRTLIVDDGWQTEDTGRGYAYCGDWEPAPSRFPDFRAHVDRVRALGMKYMIWYSVPFVGVKSRAAERFAGKFLYKRDGMGAWVLDPRFPEVREFLASTYERAVRDWNLDGLKLDFIDSFYAPDPDPAAAEDWAGRDIRSVPEAVLALMQDVRRRLEAARPGILIEFRQGYMGPAIRSFGNMIRAGDVPADPLRNRARIARLRLTSGTTAVHSDMLEWNPRETPQQAAQQILSVLFSVIQYSMRLDRLPAEHKRMMKHWIAWTAAHRDALLRGSFSPRRPELGYPLLEGASAAERVIAVYDPDFVAAVPADGRDAWIVNATDSPFLPLDLAAAPVSAEAFDVFGDPVAIAAPAAGLRRVAVPPSGLLHLRLGRAVSSWNGYEMERTDPEPGVARLLVRPRPGTPVARDAEGRPLWYWKVHFWGAFPFVDLALLARGWHVAHTTVDELYGGPECMRRMDALYDEMVARGFSPRPVLCGMSRGGLDAANWAVHRPGAPAALVLDNPVLDFRSWPLGAGARKHRWAEGWEHVKRAWGFRDDAEAMAFGGNPLPAAVAPLAAARTPVLLVQALADTVVPPEENGLPFFDALRAAGGVCEKIEKPDADHHPHSLDPPDRIVEFIERHRP